MFKQDAEGGIATQTPPVQQPAAISREHLIELLNEDLAREYQAIIAYVIYSQMLKGAAYQSIAKELEKHAGEELQHALLIAKQIDYLGGTPVSQPKEVKISEEATVMLQADLNNETVTIRNYRDRVRQCESLGEFAMAEVIRTILVQEQEHQIDLATALGVNPTQVADKEAADSQKGSASQTRNRSK
jgi:bacterioferritin